MSYIYGKAAALPLDEWHQCWSAGRHGHHLVVAPYRHLNPSN